MNDLFIHFSCPFIDKKFPVNWKGDKIKQKNIIELIQLIFIK